MSNVLTLVQQAHSLGARLWVEEKRVKLKAPSPLPPGLVTQLREHKTEVLAYLEVESRQTSSFDLPFPIGCGGLPRGQVEAAEAVNDKLGVKDPVHRKYNVLSWVRGYYQDRGENHGEHYESIKEEHQRLGQILDGEADPL